MARDICATPSRNQRHFSNSLPFCLEVVGGHFPAQIDVLFFPSWIQLQVLPIPGWATMTTTFPVACSLLPTARLEATHQKGPIASRASSDVSHFKVVLNIGTVY